MQSSFLMFNIYNFVSTIYCFLFPLQNCDIIILVQILCTDLAQPLTSNYEHRIIPTTSKTRMLISPHSSLLGVDQLAGWNMNV